jgi:hypothetical protein
VPGTTRRPAEVLREGGGIEVDGTAGDGLTMSTYIKDARKLPWEKTSCAFHEKADPCQEFFCSLHNFSIFRSAKPPLSPPFHPHSCVSDSRSVQVGCS